MYFVPLFVRTGEWRSAVRTLLPAIWNAVFYKLLQHRFGSSDIIDVRSLISNHSQSYLFSVHCYNNEKQLSVWFATDINSDPSRNRRLWNWVTTGPQNMKRREISSDSLPMYSLCLLCALWYNHSCSARTIRTLRLEKSSRTLRNFIMDMELYGTLRILRFRVWSASLS